MVDGNVAPSENWFQPRVIRRCVFRWWKSYVLENHEFFCFFFLFLFLFLFSRLLEFSWKSSPRVLVCESSRFASGKASGKLRKNVNHSAWEAGNTRVIYARTINIAWWITRSFHMWNCLWLTYVLTTVHWLDSETTFVAVGLAKKINFLVE